MKRNSYQTLLVIVTGLLVLSYVFEGGAKYWIGSASVVALLGLVSGFARRMMLLAWEKLSLALGWVNSRIILSLIFFLFLVPIAFLYKLFKGDMLFLKSPPRDSLFAKRDHLYQSKDLENPW